MNSFVLFCQCLIVVSSYVFGEPFTQNLRNVQRQNAIDSHRDALIEDAILSKPDGIDLFSIEKDDIIGEFERETVRVAIMHSTIIKIYIQKNNEYWIFNFLSAESARSFYSIIDPTDTPDQIDYRMYCYKILKADQFDDDSEYPNRHKTSLLESAGFIVAQFVAESDINPMIFITAEDENGEPSKVPVISFSANSFGISRIGLNFIVFRIEGQNDRYNMAFIINCKDRSDADDILTNIGQFRSKSYFMTIPQIIL